MLPSPPFIQSSVPSCSLKLLSSISLLTRYAKMLTERPPQATSVYKPGVVRRRSLSEVSFDLTETVPPKVVPTEVCRPTIDRSVSEGTTVQPESPLRRRAAQKKDRSGNSPKRSGMQIQYSKTSSPADQKSFDYAHSLPAPLNTSEVRTPPTPPQPISRSSHCLETPPSPHDARSTTLPGTPLLRTAPSHQPSEKTSRKRTPGRRRSKKGNKWTAKGVSCVRDTDLHTYVCRSVLPGL